MAVAELGGADGDLGEIMPNSICLAKTGALKLLDSKAARTPSFIQRF